MPSRDRAATPPITHPKSSSDNPPRPPDGGQGIVSGSAAVDADSGDEMVPERLSCGPPGSGQRGLSVYPGRVDRDRPGRQRHLALDRTEYRLGTAPRSAE